MKKTFAKMVSIAFIFALLPVLPVVAHGDESHDSGSAASAEKSFEIDDSTKAEFKANLETRLKKRKEAVTENLTFIKQKRIQKGCVASQALISKVSEKASATKTSRDEIYDNMTKNAEKLRDRLKENGQDTAALDKNLEELHTLIDSFKTDLKEMRQVAQDLSAMDCGADPAGFISSLQALRESRNKVVTDSQAIKNYIKDNLKPTLQEIRSSIGQAKQEGTN